jgi:hypothetical protein
MGTVIYARLWRSSKVSRTRRPSRYASCCHCPKNQSRDRAEEVPRFAQDLRIPFTNNQAEAEAVKAVETRAG